MHSRIKPPSLHSIPHGRVIAPHTNYIDSGSVGISGTAPSTPITLDPPEPDIKPGDLAFLELHLIPEDIKRRIIVIVLQIYDVDPKHKWPRTAEVKQLDGNITESSWLTRLYNLVHISTPSRG